MATIKIGNREFDTDKKTYVMGILNVTPDSFSDGGKYDRLDAALHHAEQMIAEGAAILDVGGESTRPGYTQISEEEEIARTIPVIEALKCRFDIPVSIDTYKSKVAEAAAGAGADLINDIWGLRYDEKMAEVIKRTGTACCLMHNRTDAVYADFFADLKEDLKQSIAIAGTAGISDDKIILDPGVGFAKSYENNLEAIRRCRELQELGFPVLLGTSRKSVIGLTLEIPAAERVIGTTVTTVFGVLGGCAFVRVHDVKENLEAIKMAEAILGKSLS